MADKRRYKSEWKPGEENREFWSEVLVGRTIKGVIWQDGRLHAFVLDDDQIVSIITNENSVATLAIKD